MQDPYPYSQMKAQFPEQEQLKCPRCASPNTKFCYYNNYNLSQPRHFCKSCKRYWTKGGALRNIPVGGGSRRNAKRSSSSAATINQQQNKRQTSLSNASVNKSSSGSNSSELLPLNGGGDSYGGHFGNLMDVGGSFTSLLDGQYNNFGHGPNLALGDHHFGGPHQLGPQAAGMGSGNSNNNGFEDEEAGESGCWSGGDGLPDLSIYSPGSNFH